MQALARTARRIICKEAAHAVLTFLHAAVTSTEVPPYGDGVLAGEEPQDVGLDTVAERVRNLARSEHNNGPMSSSRLSTLGLRDRQPVNRRGSGGIVRARPSLSSFTVLKVTVELTTNPMEPATTSSLSTTPTATRQRG